MGLAHEVGDIVWLDFDPQSGKEQSGQRSALVISPKIYNEKVGLMVACPITSRVKGYPFQVALPPNLSVQGVVLSDQLKSLDWNSRQSTVADRAPQSVLDEVRAKIKGLLKIS